MPKSDNHKNRKPEDYSSRCCNVPCRPRLITKKLIVPATRTASCSQHTPESLPWDCLWLMRADSPEALPLAGQLRTGQSRGMRAWPLPLKIHVFSEGSVWLQRAPPPLVSPQPVLWDHGGFCFYYITVELLPLPIPASPTPIELFFLKALPNELPLCKSQSPVPVPESLSKHR